MLTFLRSSLFCGLESSSSWLKLLSRSLSLWRSLFRSQTSIDRLPFLRQKGEDSSGGLARLAAQYSGLAGLAGVDVGVGQADKVDIALEILKSYNFFKENVYEDALIGLMAAEGWDKERTGT